MRIRTAQERSQLLLRRAPWDAVDSAFEKRIPFDDPSEHEDLLQRMVAENHATLHHVHLDGHRVGMIITRVDAGTAGRELVVIAASCRGNSPQPLSPLIAEAVESLAREEKCCVIRFHTVRPALASFCCERHGYRISEIVLRKDVTNG